MCPSTRNYAAEHFNDTESRNESDQANNRELAYIGLNQTCSGDDSGSAKLRQRSAGTDSKRDLHSGGRQQWRAVTDVGKCIDDMKSAWILR